MVDIYSRDLSATNAGLGTTMGARVGITPKLMARIGGTWDFVMITRDGNPAYGNLGLDFGLSYFPGRAGGPSPQGDEDEDGVPNASDICPGTPPASTVDQSGCVKRSDTDGDGVIDIKDACPDTPAGTRVDPNGCPAVGADGRPPLPRGTAPR
jgi:OOP family OmpA-OmpF porin